MHPRFFFPSPRRILHETAAGAKRELRRFTARLLMEQNLRPNGYCLIVACPRSGTSAMRRWLHRHDDIVTVDQTRILSAAFHFLEECKRFDSLDADLALLRPLIGRLVFDYYVSRVSYSRKILVEKENFELVTFPGGRYCDYLKCVLDVFPDIKLLFMIRDPVATIWSMTQRSFKDMFTERVYSLKEGIAIWNACADVIEKFGSLGNAYVCQFGRLVSDPGAESQRILRFLSVPEKPRFFSPRQTKEIGFSAAEKELILDLTKHHSQNVR